MASAATEAGGRVALGPIMQNGFVVADLEAAVHHWTTKLGVGPFFVLEHIPFGTLYLRGRPVSFDMSVAVAQWGEMQIELIVQHDETPSIYSEFRSRHGTGLQHVGVMTASLDAQLADLKLRGIEPVQWGSTTTGIRFAYVNTDEHAGGMLELIERGPAIEAFFGMVRQASVGWDGAKPLRRLG